MKTIIILFFLIPLYVLGQPNLTELNKPMGTSNADFDISKSVKTKNDFDQTNLSIEAIDTMIANLVVSQADNQLMDVEIPINIKRLQYLGFMHASKTNLFNVDATYIDANDASLASVANFYKYDNLYIKTAGNKLMDRYLVVYAIRAYLIIKYRFPEMYNLLFEKTQNIPLSFISQVQPPSFINLTKNYLIVFDGTGANPSNNNYFGSIQIGFSNPAYAVSVYPNTQVQYFNRNTILNGGSVGSVSIYSTITDSAKKFHAYMKDGFIHSFVHERLHNWIFQYTNLHSQADYLRNKSQSLGHIANYYDFEEAVVNNTTNILFEMYDRDGGLSQEILKFYRKEFDLSIAKFKTGSNYDPLKNKMQTFNPNNASTAPKYSKSSSYKNLDNRVFFLDLYSGSNTPR